MRIDLQLNDNQHAYRAMSSCHTALTKFTNNIFKSIEKTKNKVGAIFIDFSKAFDSIKHTTLVRKLMYIYKIEQWLVNITHKNMNNRVFNIDCNERCFSLSRGICQGSPNRPVLFVYKLHC